MTANTPRTFSEPVIFHKLSDLYLATHKRILRFPKPSRYSLGVRMENTILEIIEFSYLALTKQSTSKLLIINKTDITLRMFFTHLRLANKTHCLNDAGYAELSEGALEIGKMIGNWIKEIKKAPTAQNEQLTLNPLKKEAWFLREDTTPIFVQSLSGLFLFTFAPFASALPKLRKLPSVEALYLLDAIQICIGTDEKICIGADWRGHITRALIFPLLNNSRASAQQAEIIGNATLAPRFITTSNYTTQSVQDPSPLSGPKGIQKLKIQNSKIQKREDTTPIFVQPLSGLRPYTFAPRASASPKLRKLPSVEALFDKERFPSVNSCLPFLKETR